MRKKRIKMVIDSDLNNVHLIDMLIETLCSLVSLTDDKAFWIKLCAVEAVNNCIIHAYERMAGNDVEVIFSLYADKLVLEICDTGKAMNKALLNSNNIFGADDDNPADISTVEHKGRGLAIIRNMMDSVSYITDGGKNCLIMQKELNLTP